MAPTAPKTANRAGPPVSLPGQTSSMAMPRSTVPETPTRSPSSRPPAWMAQPSSPTWRNRSPNSLHPWRRPGRPSATRRMQWPRSSRSSPSPPGGTATSTTPACAVRRPWPSGARPSTSAPPPPPSPTRWRCSPGSRTLPRMKNYPTVPELSTPRGYSYVVTATGKMVFIAGQIALDKEGNLVGRGDLRAQTVQVLENV
ncbi:MAG: hypothetical protein KJ048_18605, partial [Dehalococcoidia bacterium]|nr:hypothetical protein [Dehalococcoidia bacterium]